MEKIIYVKYNSTRNPRYQTMTMLTEEKGQRWVKKLPMRPETEEHIKSFSEKSKQMHMLYKNVRVVDVSMEEPDCAVFPYIQGKTMGSIVESGLDSIQSALEQMKNIMETIDDYRTEMLVDFQMSEGFKSVFGELEYQGKAVKVANVDEILDNFLCDGADTVLIDYEWVFFFPVPVRYIQFRTVFYFLVKNHSIITRQIGEEDYLRAFGYDKKEVQMWKQVEMHFQEYVHGEKHCYMYPQHYEKEVHNMNRLINTILDIRGGLKRTKEDLKKKLGISS